MALSRTLLSPLHRFPVLWSSYRPLLRAARTAPLDEHHRLAIEQYIKREFRQWRRLRTADKVRAKLREAEEFLHRLESAAHSTGHLERMRELADHLILRQAKKPMHVVKPRLVPRPVPSIIRASAFNPPMLRMRPQPIKTTMMICDRRRASQRRYDKRVLAKELVDISEQEERIERAAGVRDSRQQAIATTRVADEWRDWIRQAQRREQREYKRKERQQLSRRIELRGTPSRLFSASATPAGQVKPFVLADIGEGITECEIVKWLVKEGDVIEEFDPVVEVMSDKASVEITSPFSGKIASLAGAAGDMLKVGSVLCSIEVAGGESDAEAAPPAAQSAPEPSPAPTTPSVAFSLSSSTGFSLAPSHTPHSRPSSNDILATPATRRFAREHNVDLSSITGTGRDGRITKEDIWNFVSESASSATTTAPARVPAPSGGSAPAPTAESTTIPLNSTRKAMYRAMSASLQIPHFSYSDVVDVTAIERMRLTLAANIPLQYRKTLKPADEATLARHEQWSGAARVDPTRQFDRITLLPLLLKALSLAMSEHPIFTCTLSPPPSAGPASTDPSLVRRPTHDISVALSNPSPAGGLFTPVLRSVDSSSVFDLASRLAHLQSLLPSSGNGAPKFPPEYQGAGTLTLSNIGVIGGRTTHPVVPPTGQLAIGAIGRTRVETRFVDEARAKRVASGVEGPAELKIEPRLVMDVTFSADHRVVEGVELARLVESWKRIVENPARLAA
ncbi:2-oxoisovalerate dehydrogenase E2 component [Rhodotorula toruloides]|uniref:Dihydrolipoamide acetyltransferase component of pyruvate dehydrogenase complex n=1 Tax=Rhodotorula toruloides TaxID=5286 RepID=A0A511KLQ7_RHOTO|nr:2-oxoisovalerate dehydrogenase E2 component [Rhodotorula toruloides]